MGFNAIEVECPECGNKYLKKAPFQVKCKECSKFKPLEVECPDCGVKYLKKSTFQSRCKACAKKSRIEKKEKEVSIVKERVEEGNRLREEANLPEEIVIKKMDIAVKKSKLFDEAEEDVVEGEEAMVAEENRQEKEKDDEIQDNVEKNPFQCDELEEFQAYTEEDEDFVSNRLFKHTSIVLKQVYG